MLLRFFVPVLEVDNVLSLRVFFLLFPAVFLDMKSKIGYIVRPPSGCQMGVTVK